MFFRKRIRMTRQQPVAGIPNRMTVETATPEDELRRQMYERIARNHAMLDAEETAQRNLRGR